jgi:hypothetical protein
MKKNPAFLPVIPANAGIQWVYIKSIFELLDSRRSQPSNGVVGGENDVLP